MATAYSSLLGLALPVQGELPGQWGNEVNNYITNYLDASVAGGLSITADVTLTKTTGSALGATSSQYAILTCSPASVNIVVTAPAAYKIYVVNNTSASYTVTIRGAGPTTGVVLSALEKAVVAWNGTDFFKVATSATDGVSTFSAGSTGLTPSSATSGAVTLAGTLAVLNGGTGVTTSTGTTNVVLSNSPTLVTPALGSPSSVGTMPAFTLGGTVSGGGNQINNVIIGTTTPLAASFTTVTTTGNAGIGTTAAGSSRLAVVATSLSAATFTQTGATGYGVGIVPGADTVYDAFSINNAANTLNNIQMYGNGSARFAGLVTAQASLAVTGTLSATGTLSGGTSGTAYSFSGSAPATSLTLNSSGDLGIGTSSPAYKLEVVGAATSTQYFQRSIAPATESGTETAIITTGNSSNQRAGMYASNTYASNSATELIFKTNDATGGATERMRIDAVGTVTMSAYGAGAATFSSAGVISSVSDETWKIKDGVPVDTDAMLKKLEPGYWYYNDEKKETFGADRQLGFYAQNVNAAIGPEAAPTPQEGKPWGYYDRSVLAITVMSLQKALATIETLTARITALETA